MAAVSIIAYNFYKNVQQPVNKTSFEAIPQNAALILKETNFSVLYNKLSTTNIIWEDLISNTEIAQETTTNLHYLDSLLRGTLKPLFSDKPILTSLHLSGANDFGFIFYITISEDITEDKLIRKIKNVTHKNPESRKYDGATIHTFPTNKDSKISIIIYRNTLAFSYSTSLIEDVVRQLNTETSLINDANFARMIANSGHSEDGNLFINNKYISKIINQYINKSSKKYTNKLERYTNWTELDLNIKSNSISLNGFSFSDDNNWVTLFKNQKSQNIDILTIAPFNTAFLYHYGLSNPERYFEDRKLSLKNTNQFFNFQKYLDNQTQKYSIDLEEELLANIGHEVSFIITESLTEDFSNNKFVVFQTNNIKKTTTDLLSISSKVNEVAFELIDFNDYIINKIEINNVFNNLFGKPFVNLELHFYTVIDDYVVFGNSESGLKKFITNVINEKTLENNDSFNDFSDNLSSNSNIFIYNNVARSTNLYKQFSIEKYLPIYDDKIDMFRKFEALSLQVSSEKNGLYYNNIHLKYNPVYKQETASLWELMLDTSISSTPYIVLNHKTKAKEIFVQDNANKIYLISNIGKVIWTKQLQEPIMGGIHQIDVYKNNKLQLLFNTRSKIYLIDRNGNNVESYPVKLPSKATNEVNPLDYTHNRNYRIIIGCEDNMLYNYDITGAKTKGWKFKPGSSFSTGKTWHFSNSNKDYIVVPLESGEVKVIQRNGKDRLILESKLEVSSNPIYLKVGNTIANTYLTTMDSLGNISQLNLNGKTSLIINEYNQPEAKFNFFDFNNNNSKDFAIAYENNIKIIDIDKKELYSNTFETAITHPPLYFNISNKETSLGIVTENKIYLINTKGTITDGFPLTGSTPFSIDDLNNDNTSNLVVAHGKMIYTYNLK